MQRGVLGEDYDVVLMLQNDRTGAPVGWLPLLTHPASKCERGYSPCTIHRQTAHRMQTWPQLWDPTISIVSRLCEHNVAHPDPDDLLVRRLEPVDCHLFMCDGCCGQAGADTRQVPHR